MLLSSGFSLVSRFASPGSFPISCCNSSVITANLIFKIHFCGILKLVKIREIKLVKFEFSIYDPQLHSWLRPNP